MCLGGRVGVNEPLTGFDPLPLQAPRIIASNKGGQVIVRIFWSFDDLLVYWVKGPPDYRIVGPLGLFPWVQRRLTLVR